MVRLQNEITVFRPATKASCEISAAWIVDVLKVGPELHRSDRREAVEHLAYVFVAVVHEFPVIGMSLVVEPLVARLSAIGVRGAYGDSDEVIRSTERAVIFAAERDLPVRS